MKAVKKFLYLMICIVMIVTVMPTASYAADETLATFSDIPEDWSKPGLLKALENGLLTGYEGRIMPKDFLTRAQMAAILNKSFGASKMASLANYGDMKTSQWYFKDLSIAVEMGTFVGSNNLMKPENFITREEVFVVIAKAFNLTDGALNSTMKFMDATDISGWAKPLVASMIEEGYAKGAYGKLNPKNFMTRAEFAALMNNLVQNYVRKAGTYTGDYSGSLLVSTKDVLLKDMVIDGDLIIGDGVGDGEVVLENVIVTGRTIVRGLAQLVELDLEDEAVALGAGGVPGSNNPGQGQGQNPNPNPPGPNPPPNTSVYGFRLIKEVGTQKISVLVDELTFRDNDKVNFQMVSDVYDRGNADFIAALNTHTDFIERALQLKSVRSGKLYTYTLAQRVLNYSDRPNLKVFKDPRIIDIFEAIDANVAENATPVQVKAMVDLLLSFSLKDIIRDFELLYPYDDDFVAKDFSIWTYNGTTLVKQEQLLIRDIEKKLDKIYNDYTIGQLTGKRIMMVEFGDEKVYLEIDVFK